MTDSSSNPGPSKPGAERRARLREEREKQRAISTWMRPGVLLFGLVTALALAGALFVVRDTQRVPSDQASFDGLDLELVQARWLLDQMDHGENFQKPSTMMPDMPEWGSQRVTIELSMTNRSEDPVTFNGGEFYLVPQNGEAVSPIGANVGYAQLSPGQNLNTAIHFDFDTNQPYGKLSVEWRRGSRTAYLPVPEPAEHYHLRPRGGEVALPPRAALLLPLGKGRRGRDLYVGVYGCVACHGDPQIPESNNVGPHLAGVSLAAASRIEGMPAEQYLYESVVDPNGFIAPECKDGRPCSEPSAMPEYASLINLQDAADLLTYLLEL